MAADESELTPEQIKFQEELKKHLDSLPNELKKYVVELRNLVKPLPAFQTLTTLASEYLLMDPETYSESKLTNEFLAIEYITWIFLTNSTIVTDNWLKIDGDIQPNYVDSPTYDKIQELLDKLLTGTQLLNLKLKDENNAAISEVKYFARSHYNFVRNPSYIHHYRKTIEGLFNNFSPQLKEILGFDLEQAIKIIFYIDKNFEKKLHNRAAKSKESKDKLLKRYDHLKAGKIIPESQFEEIALKYKKENFDTQIDNLTVAWAWIFMEEAFTFSVTEVASGTKLPEEVVKSFFDLFSLTFGQKEIGDSLPSRYDQLEESPLIKISNDTYFCHLYNKLLWALKPNFEKALKNSPYWRRYESSRKTYLENESLNLLQNSLPGSKMYLNLKYSAKDRSGNIQMTELDGLIIYDSILFLIEGKAGAVSAAARRGASSISEELDDLIKESHYQAQRALEYIQSSDQVNFDLIDRTKLVINKKSFTRFILITVSLDDLSVFTMRLANLRNIGLLKEGLYPWAISLDDLRIVTDLLKGPEFVHYLQRRLRLDEIPKLYFPDEVDCLGHYFKRGLYFEDNPFPDADLVSLVGFGEDIDNFYLYKQKLRKTPVPKPQQPIPSELKAIINQLLKEKRQGFVEVVCSFLEGSEEARSDLENLIKTRKEHSKVLKITGGGLTISDFALAIVCSWGNEERRYKFLSDYLKAIKILYVKDKAVGIIFDTNNLELPPLPLLDFEPIYPTSLDVRWAKIFISQLPKLAKKNP